MDTPAPFVYKTFIAECHEYGNGERCVKIYHKNLTIYTPSKAQLHSPVMAFKFANWMVKASEWIGEQQVYKAAKKNTVQPSND